MGLIVLLCAVLIIPLGLTIWNLGTFLFYLIKKRERKCNKVVEVIAMSIGLLFLAMYAELAEICFVGWNTQLHNIQKHSMIAPEFFATIVVIMVVAFLGYVLMRFIPVQKQSPIISAIGIAAIYLGIGVNIVWCIQTFENPVLIVLPANCIIIFFKTIYMVVYGKNSLIQTRKVTLKYPWLLEILNKAINLPWLGLLLVLPLLGIIVAILFLFGQEPGSIIKAWTETADWTLSQRVAPPNVMFDEHYLCTVAAGGHQKIVKPQRIGMRHGHVVLVNRQLCIANAFEQILEERMPSVHKVVRHIYDSTGYPVARHIRSKYLADFIYYIMKPLEWIFLIVLYTVDVNPEDRIAVQYPHKPLDNK